MSISIPRPPRADVVYPDSDGLPIAEDTLQFDWIAKLWHGLNVVFKDDPNVFVAADLFWYPVEGRPDIRTAPDGLVAFNRPKGHRGSYRQWEEGGIAPQVVFEVLSHKADLEELASKHRFYECYGAEEYYRYDPHHNVLDGYIRSGDHLNTIERVNGWVSPRLGVRFELAETTLRIIGPDGRPFLTYLELLEQIDEAKRLAEAKAEARAATREVERLEALLREHGIDPSTV